MTVARVTCAPEPLRRVCEALFVRSGLSADDASIVVDVLMYAELRGIETHGLYRVLTYADLLRTGVHANGRPRVLTDSGAVVLVDGGNALGPVAAQFAMQQAISRAHKTGVATVGVRGSNHCGALGYYAMQATDQDMVGIAISHAQPSMAPWGGRERLLGNNPIAVGAPSDGAFPLLFDGSFAQAFPLKVQWREAEGLPLPQGWLLDEDGAPTDDYASAATGSFRPVGDHHGSGLALLLGVLAAVLTGSSFGREVLDADGHLLPGVDGHLMLAIDSRAFGSSEVFKQRVAGIVTDFSASASAGAEPVRVPGQRAAANEARCIREGIPLRETTWSRLAERAEELEIATGEVRVQ